MDVNTEKILNLVVQNGYRRTNARQEIVAALVNSAGHITADDLADKVREQAPRVGRMTVYRTLDLLCELSLVRPIYQGAGAAHYVLMTNGSHHHLICNQCHKVIEFDECGSDELVEMLSSKFGFTVHSHLFEIHGICRNCHI